jgi:hypothetical protein
MNTTTYTVLATPSPFGGTKTKSQSITGTNNVTFDLAGLSAYDGMAGGNYRVNKVVVDFDDGEELVINRPLSASTIPTLSGETFTHIIESDFTNAAKRHVYFTLYRDDQEVDVIDLKFTVYKAPISNYENVNLLKTDYFSDDNNDEKLLLTFINKNPEVLGLNLLDIDTDKEELFDPSLSTSQGISAESFNVGFTTEYVHIKASESNTSNAIQVQIGDILNPNTGLPKTNGAIHLKYRTRAANPDTMSNHHIAFPNNPALFYIPLTANSSFAHLSGYLHWNCGDLLKDVDLSTKTITIPLIDIVGTRVSLGDYYFTNVNTGCGTSIHGMTSGGYFYVDLYDINGCDSLTTTTSTITAFVNY